MSRDYYEFLGVRQSATDTSVKRAIQTAMVQIAADASLSPLQRESRLAELKTATDILGTPVKRDQYDAALRLTPGANAGGAKVLMTSPATWIIVLAVGVIGGALYWQYDRAQANQRIERERIATDQAEERRAKENEARRAQEKQRLLDELHAQREADDKSRQASNEIRSAESQKKQYTADDRAVLQTTNSTSSFESSRRDYDDRRQLGTEALQRAMEERKQQLEEEMNLRRAKADVDRQKRYLEQLEREDQYARARREADARPGR